MFNEEMYKVCKNTVIENIQNSEFSLRGLSKETGISPATLSGIINDKRDIKLKSLLSIADKLEMSLDDLTGFKSFSTKEDGDPTIDDYAYLQRRYYQMQHSLSALYASLNGISKFSKLNDDMQKVVDYVQNSINLVLKGKVLEEEAIPISE